MPSLYIWVMLWKHFHSCEVFNYIVLFYTFLCLFSIVMILKILVNNVYSIVWKYYILKDKRITVLTIAT